MGSFTDKIDTLALINQHSGAVTILVEGESDERFLERMFPYMKADIRFKSVGGCTRMAARLEEERRSNPKVYGLLDRDALKREKRWAALFETDDAAFAAATRGDGLFVLARWEIENYLFEHGAVLELFKTWRKTPDTEDGLADLLIRTAEAELHVTAAFCTAQYYGVSEDGAPDPACDVSVLPGQVRQWIMAQVTDDETVHPGHVAKVQAFDPGGGADKKDRLAGLLRMVDGKRFLRRLQYRWMSMRNDDPSLQLASNVGALATPPRSDLHRIIQDLKAVS